MKEKGSACIFKEQISNLIVTWFQTDCGHITSYKQPFKHTEIAYESEQNLQQFSTACVSGCVHNMCVFLLFEVHQNPPGLGWKRTQKFASGSQVWHTRKEFHVFFWEVQSWAERVPLDLKFIKKLTIFNIFIILFAPFITSILHGHNASFHVFFFCYGPTVALYRFGCYATFPFI